MNKYFKTIATAMVAFAFVLSAFAAPLANAFSTTTLITDPLVDLGALTSLMANTESVSLNKCTLIASRNLVTVGEGVTLNWDTTGFTSITLNGEAVSGNSGSRTFDNLSVDSTFVLKAISNDGSTCTQKVKVTCLPPKEECKLELNKTVDKTAATPGEQLTYAINVKNVGTANCTGGGVKIKDVVDSNIDYVSYEITSNLSAGYGSNPVYTSADRTLNFNGNTLEPGEAGTVTWVGKVKTPTQCGDFNVKNQAKATAKELNNFQDWAYSQTVKTAISNNCDEPTPPNCPLTAAPGRTIVDFTGLTYKLKSNGTIAIAQTPVQSINVPAGQYDITLVSWDGYNDRVNVSQPHEQYQLQFMNGSSVLASSGIIGDLADNVREATNVEKVNSGFVLANAATGLRAVHAFYPDKTSANSLSPICAALDKKTVELVPTCDLFTATPNSIMVGGKATLTWETTNAVQVLIDNAIGSVNPDGSIEVSPLANTTYKLTVIGANNKTANCEVPVTVTEDSVPACKFFTATPGTLPVGGGKVTLDWEVLNATGVTIAPTVGVVGLVGTSSVNITDSTTFTLTAVDADGDKVTCPAPVVVADPGPLTCANNVSFSASDTSINRGEEITLNWSTTNVDTVSISVIGATALTGNQKVSPSDDTTYVLTATQGSETVNCPISIDVTSGGGGGGGSPSPRCDLKISDTKIKLGEQIILTWDTSNVTEVTLTDDRGKVIFTTDDYLAADKKDYYDHSIKLKPTRDTKYTLLAERGSRDEECKVAVNLEDSIVVLQTRDQQPLVAGISLSQVPYTGFEAGPFMTIMFYALLVAWSLYITYMLVVRKKMATPNSISGKTLSSVTPNQTAMKQAETIRPDAFVASVAVATPTTVIAPTNLPTGKTVVGYENHIEEEVVNPHQVDDQLVTELENRAHAQHALLSSDAVRHFVGTTSNEVERNEALDSVISEAKKKYPLEDGWIVINELRMKNLCETCQVNSEAAKGTSFIPATVPEGTGSLAEAIVTGNVAAAYEMIGNRPMFALADAAADLDAVYRSRRGGVVQVSEMLITETKDLSDEKIKNMIDALTGALDGTYTDEVSAVKIAIMKAVKVGA